MNQIIQKELKEQICNEIKGYIAMRGLTYKQLAQIIQNKYGMSLSPQSLSNKLSRGSIKYMDVIKIANALDYKIKWL